MRLITRTAWLLLFLLLLAFAAKNTAPVALRFYFDLLWQAPLVLVLFAFFAAGALFGVLATLGTVLRQRRAVHRLQREAHERPQPDAAEG